MGKLGEDDLDLDSLAADGMVEELREAAMELKKRFNFDTIQILATTLEANGNTRSYKSGVGNWYARYGQAAGFVRECEDENSEGARGGDAGEDGL